MAKKQNSFLVCVALSVILVVLIIWAINLPDNTIIRAHVPNPRDLADMNAVVLNDEIDSWDEVYIEFNIQEKVKAGESFSVYSLSHSLFYGPSVSPMITLSGPNEPSFSGVLKTVQGILKKQGAAFDEKPELKDKYLIQKTLVLRIGVLQDKAKWNEWWKKIFREYTRFFFNVRVERVSSTTTYKIIDAIRWKKYTKNTPGTKL